MHSPARLIYRGTRKSLFSSHSKNSYKPLKKLMKNITDFRVPGLAIELQRSTHPSKIHPQNASKKYQISSNIIQKPCRVHSSAVRMSWETILCAFWSWDRAWQHPNIFWHACQKHQSSIYGFLPRRARRRRPDTRDTRIGNAPQNPTSKPQSQVSNLHPCPGDRVPFNHYVHRVRDARISRNTVSKIFPRPLGRFLSPPNDFSSFQHLKIVLQHWKNWLGVCFSTWKLRQKWKLLIEKNRQLPHTDCPAKCPFRKLGSRMDAPIFVFNRYMKFTKSGAHFNR